MNTEDKIVKVVDGTNPSAHELTIATKGAVEALAAYIVDSSGSQVSIFGDTSNYGGFVDTTSIADVLFVCDCPVGSTGDTSDAIWRIQKIDTSTGDVIITWADGDENFDNIADNRATTITYS